MQKISQYELAAGVFLVQMGSSPLFLLAKSAHRDAWAAVLLGLLGGLVLLVAVTLPMYRRDPGRNLVEMLTTYMGKWLGGAIAAAYLLYFAYQSVRNVREFGDWMLSYLLPTTPLAFVAFVLMLVSAYAVFHGPDVYFRLALLVAPVVILLYGLLFSPILISHLFQPERLQPVMEHGLRPVLEAAFPVVSFPFGEMVLFLMFLKYADRSRKATRTTTLTFLFVGALLIVTNVLAVGVLGPIAESNTIPLLESASLFEIEERLDPLVLTLLFVGVFMKQTIYYLAAVMTLSHLTGWKHRHSMLAVGVLIYVGALAFRSYMEQVRIGFRYNVIYHFPIFEIAIPIVLLLIVLLRSPKTTTMGEYDE